MNILNIFKNTNGNLSLFIYLIVLIFVLGKFFGYKLVSQKFLFILLVINLLGLL